MQRAADALRALDHGDPEIAPGRSNRRRHASGAGTEDQEVVRVRRHKLGGWHWLRAVVMEENRVG